jgi:hypothetical protein
LLYMTEQYMVIHNKGHTLGMFVVRLHDLGYMDRRVVAYVIPEAKEAISGLQDVFADRHVNIRDFKKKAVEAISEALTANVSITEPLYFTSQNKVKTVRDKTILGTENYKKYARMVMKIGIESVGRLRARK